MIRVTRSKIGLLTLKVDQSKGQSDFLKESVKKVTSRRLSPKIKSK